jgi:hypothetical protein
MQNWVLFIYCITIKNFVNFEMIWMLFLVKKEGGGIEPKLTDR